MIEFVATVIEGDIDNPAFYTGIRKLIFSQGMMEAPGSLELLELREVRDSNQRSSRELWALRALV